MFSHHRDIKPPNSKGMMLIISALTFTRALKCTGSVSLCGNGPPDTCYLPECLLWAFTTHRSLAEKVKLLTSGRKKKKDSSQTRVLNLKVEQKCQEITSYIYSSVESGFQLIFDHLSQLTSPTHNITSNCAASHRSFAVLL